MTKAVEPGETPASATDERKLLIDAVTLLARNQSQAESQLAQQTTETSRRMLALERRCLDLEQHLDAIHEQLDKLTREVLLPADAESQQRLAELRGELARLARHGEAPPPPTGAPLLATDFDVVRPAPADAPAAPVEPRTAVQSDPVVVPTPPAPPATSPGAPRAVWRRSDVLTQDNAGLLLIGLGAVAVLFAVLTQVHV